MKIIMTDSYTYTLVKSKAFVKTESDNIVLTEKEFDYRCLKDLDVRNGDVITVEYSENIDKLFDKKLSLTDNVVKSSNDPKSGLHEINVVNMLFDKNNLLTTDLKVNKLTVERSETIKNIRLLALSLINSDNSEIVN